jgi:ABC-type dipeptide/oligopeptide/nickel transport system ATPase component
MLLKVKDLSLNFPRLGFTAANQVNFSIGEAEVLALVGESGSGKSLTALSILGLQPVTAERQGEVWFKGQMISEYKFEQYRTIRGKSITYIPQDPLSSLNPVYRVGDQLLEAIWVHSHKRYTKKEAKEKILDYLDKVGIADPRRCFDAYPHEISGGMRQRIMIAMAIINDPDLIIADEPTTALDVTVQAVILELLRSLRKTILFITHDLGVVAEIADRVIVMKQGAIVEEASVFNIFNNPREAYTKELLAAAQGFGFLHHAP